MKKIIWLITLSLISIKSFAATDFQGSDALQYMAFANGELVFDTLMAVKAIMAKSAYSLLILTISLASFMYVLVSRVLAGKYIELVYYFLIVWFGAFLALKQTVDVVVEDVVLDPNGNNFVGLVTGVPLGIGLPLVAINNVGTGITSWYETNFTNLDSTLTLSGGGGFSATSRIVKDMSQMRISDPQVSATISGYFEACVLPEIYANRMSIRDLIESNNVLSLIETSSEVRFADINGVIMSCNKAYDDEVKPFIESIETDPTMAQKFTEKFGSGTVGDGISSAIGGALASPVLMDAALQQATGQASGSAKFISNRILIGGLQDGVKTAALLTESDPLIASLNLDQAKRGQVISWYTTAELFQDMAGYFYATMNVLVIALMPIVILGLFIPGFGMKVVSSFIKVLVWLSLWWPGLAIVNFITTSYLANSIDVSRPGTFCISACDATSFKAVEKISAFSSKATMAAGFLATIVPMIMWAIVSGSAQAFVSAIQGASGKQQAGVAAGNIATDSFTDKNISSNNLSSNKFDDSHSYSSGFQPSVMHNGASATTTTDYMSSQQVKVGDTLVGNAETTSNEFTSQEQARRTEAVQSNFMNQATGEIQETFAKMKSEMDQYGSSFQVNSGEGTDQKLSRNNSFAEELASELSVVSANMDTAASNTALSGAIGATYGAQKKEEFDALDNEGKKGFLSSIGIQAKADGSYGTTNSEQEVAGESQGVKTSDKVSTQDSKQLDLNQSHGKTHAALDGSATADGSSYQDSDAYKRMDAYSNQYSSGMESINQLAASSSAGSQTSVQKDATFDTLNDIEGERNQRIDRVTNDMDEVKAEVAKEGGELKSDTKTNVGKAETAVNAGEADVDQGIKAVEGDVGRQNQQVTGALTGAASELAGYNVNEIMARDEVVEKNMSSYGDKSKAELADLSIQVGDFTATPTGMMNLKDEDGNVSSEAIYTISNKEGETIGTAALVKNDEGGVDLVTQKGETFEDQKAYKENLEDLQDSADDPGALVTMLQDGAGVAKEAIDGVAGMFGFETDVLADYQFQGQAKSDAEAVEAEVIGTIDNTSIKFNPSAYNVINDTDPYSSPIAPTASERIGGINDPTASGNEGRIVKDGGTEITNAAPSKKSLT